LSRKIRLLWINSRFFSQARSVDHFGRIAGAVFRPPFLLSGAIFKAKAIETPRAEVPLLNRTQQAPLEQLVHECDEAESRVLSVPRK
jgi:hypothetical protein